MIKTIKKKYTLLDNAVTDGDLNHVKHIVEKYNINLKRYDRKSTNEGKLLRLAMVICKDIELVKYLIENGCKVNLKHYTYFGPPLHWAILIDDLGLPFVKCLIENGAKFEVYDNDPYGNATILFAIINNKMDIIKYFLSLKLEGINVNSILRDSYKQILNQISVSTKVMLLNHFQENTMINKSLKKHINKSNIIQKFNKVLLDIRLLPGIGIDYQNAFQRFQKYV